MNCSLQMIGAMLLAAMFAFSTLYCALSEFGEGTEPLYEVNAIGAPTTGVLVEGAAGAACKGVHHRFSCHTEGPKPGFLGPLAVAKPTSIRCQPGIFPAPIAGPASLTFTFTCLNNKNPMTPIVMRPDGTALKGFPMTLEDFPQTIVVSYPAQTGIYTLFILPHGIENQNVHAIVEVSKSTKPHRVNTYALKAFGRTNKDEDKISAEFIYSPFRN